MSSDLVAGYLLRKRPFPGSASLWILLDDSGARQEVLERGATHSRRIQLLDYLTVGIKSGRSRYQIVHSLEQCRSTPFNTSPGWFAFSSWLAELLDVGIMPDDPHPELVRLLNSLPVSEPKPDIDLWGRVADVVLSTYGIWVAPQNCHCPGSHETRAGLRGYCPACIRQIDGKLMTQCGKHKVSLAQLLREVDAVVAQAFEYQMKSSVLARELGIRNVL